MRHVTKPFMFLALVLAVMFSVMSLCVRAQGADTGARKRYCFSPILA